ncbi:TIGR02147 family protein [Bdellovibrio sp. GT3]|uniref:TIGR02147 family protein n=1 Tax=Bdellovibrio sp. GT3 TaxID=3136282 RepID=UPI0030F04EC4
MKLDQSFHYKYLADEFARRSNANPHYSLRSFARDLEVTPSWLSDFLSNKKGMAPKTAERLSVLLGMALTESRVFILSSKAFHSRSEKDRKAATLELASFKQTKSYKMRPKDFSATGTWYHQAILELTEVEGFSHHEYELMERLRLPQATIRRAIQDLIAAELLKIEDGKMKPCFPETESTMDISSIAIRNFHEQVLNKGIKALHEQTVTHREFGSTTFAFDDSKIDEAKKALRKFQKQFADDFYTKSANKNSVYQFSVQFFRIDRKKGMS